MAILAGLVALYREQGIEICSGLSPQRFTGLPHAPFTRFIRDGRSLTAGLGIAPQEIYLLEHLFAAYQPRRVIIVGNSLGWSTIAMGLLLPDSRIVAMDSGLEENSLYGIGLTNRIGAAADLPTRAVRGTSPGDVAAVANGELGGAIDFAFDGLHTNAQVVLDYEAVHERAAGDAVALFHDVHAFNLYEGLTKIERIAGLAARPLAATPSGMALLYDPAAHPELDGAIAAFAPSEPALALVDRETTHARRLRRWRLIRRVRHRLARLSTLTRGTRPAVP